MSACVCVCFVCARAMLVRQAASACNAGECVLCTALTFLAHVGGGLACVQEQNMTSHDIT